MERRLLFKTCSRTLEDLEKEMQGSTINGRNFSLRDTSSVVEICGNIGVVYPPSDYATWPLGRIYSLHELDKGMIGYAAVRFVPKGEDNSSHDATFVIDSFGVLDSTRGSGIGKILFNYIKSDVCAKSHADGSKTWIGSVIEKGLLGKAESCTLSIQSTFDFESYCSALASNTTEQSHRGSHVVTINMTAVLRQVHGSCDFWRKMGFASEKIVCSGGFNVASPIIIMWQKIK